MKHFYRSIYEPLKLALFKNILLRSLKKLIRRIRISLRISLLKVLKIKKLKLPRGKNFLIKKAFSQ